MNELSLHILDLAQNAVSAGAARVDISVRTDGDRLRIVIADDGRGMDAELLERVADPFTTTRPGRKVGLGIPLIKELCETCDGRFEIASREGEGTTLSLEFRRSHIDLPPMGGLVDTMVTLVSGAPEGPEFRLRYANGGEEFAFDTAEIRGALKGAPLNSPEVLGWVREYLAEGIEAAGKLA